MHVGRGAGGKHDAADETEDAIKDHNEIRDAVAEVSKHDVASDGWFRAIAAANKANSDHMGEEERQGLTDFRLRASLELRQQLAVEFVHFEANHVNGVVAVDRDPKDYIARNS